MSEQNCAQCEGTGVVPCDNCGESDDPIIEIPVDDILDTLGHGTRWIQGGWQDGDKMCLHQAIRVCHPVPGDAYLIQQVGDRCGYGIKFNDDNGTDFMLLEQKLRLQKEGIDDEQLEAIFGPQWRMVVGLVRRMATLTETEASSCATAGDATWEATWYAAWDAVWYAARAAARDAAEAAAGAAAWDATKDVARPVAWDATRAVVVGDLIGQHGFTQAHYDKLVSPLESVLGPIADFPGVPT